MCNLRGSPPPRPSSTFVPAPGAKAGKAAVVAADIDAGAALPPRFATSTPLSLSALVVVALGCGLGRTEALRTRNGTKAPMLPGVVGFT